MIYHPVDILELFNNFHIARYLNLGKLEAVTSNIYMDTCVLKGLSSFLIIFSG